MIFNGRRDYRRMDLIRKITHIDAGGNKELTNESIFFLIKQRK